MVLKQLSEIPIMPSLPIAALKSPDLIPLGDTRGPSLTSTNGVHTALLVIPHVSFDCGQTGRSAQALLTFPAIRGLRNRVLFLSLLGCPCPYQDLFRVPASLGRLRKQDIHSTWGYIILLGPQEVAVCGITNPPSLHSPSLVGIM